MTDGRRQAEAARDRMLAWLIDHALPLWSSLGVDAETGAVVEAIGQDGSLVDRPRRGRVTPRQIYAFKVARDLGGALPHALLERMGQTMIARFRRDDGLFRTLVDSGGAVLDDSVSLYDQAFMLLALAHLKDELAEAETTALQLRSALVGRLKHPGGGFHETEPPTAPLGSNPHMHLFEAFMAWSEAGGDEGWVDLAAEIAGLALSRFTDPETGALREFFDLDWRPAAGRAGRVVEPGHQFEWGWLLLRWAERTGDEAARRAAFRLIDIGEMRGVDLGRGVAFNALLDDLSVLDGDARLWPQTERIKAHAVAARLTGRDAGWTLAAAAVEGLERYLATPIPGLWHDRLTVDGDLIEEPAPASSFYHIVCAVDGLTSALRN